MNPSNNQTPNQINNNLISKQDNGQQQADNQYRQQPSVVDPSTFSQQPQKKKSVIGVGILVFLILSILFLSPLLPGKIINSGSTITPIDTGTDSLASIECFTRGPDKTNIVYSSKFGFPLAYKYEAKTQLIVDCEDGEQVVESGKSSGFNMIALVADFVIVVLLSFTLAKIIQKVRK